MKKLVIFNVGGAMSCYADLDEKKTLIDLGISPEMSPVDDFLIPLSDRGKFTIWADEHNRGKYRIDQLFLSHLDKDHISDYEKFRNNFHPFYMTCPNDNDNQIDGFKINRDLIGPEYDIRNLVLADMKKRDTTEPNLYKMSPSNPLVSIVDEISLFYIQPSLCESVEELKTGYANNLSLVIFLQVGKKTLLLPGDILKEGMEYLIKSNYNFKLNLSFNGVDYLIAPHHGLQTSFSEYLFHTINGNKTRLNIISEKTREEDSSENRSDVDKRYYSSDYSTGDNSLNQNAVKTSMGHIVIDFETEETEVQQYSDIQDVINEFN